MVNIGWVHLKQLSDGCNSFFFNSATSTSLESIFTKNASKGVALIGLPSPDNCDYSLYVKIDINSPRDDDYLKNGTIYLR